MKNTLIQSWKHAPVNGCMAIRQRASRLFGSVGMKF
jgi:hypothetical protein